jgi:hypothetical protein
MILFNMYEDITPSIASLMSSGFNDLHFVGGHLVHFLAMLDFCSLFLQQAYNSKVAKTDVANSGSLQNFS